MHTNNNYTVKCVSGGKVLPQVIPANQMRLYIPAKNSEAEDIHNDKTCHTEHPVLET